MKRRGIDEKNLRIVIAFFYLFVNVAMEAIPIL